RRGIQRQGDEAAGDRSPQKGDRRRQRGRRTEIGCRVEQIIAEYDTGSRKPSRVSGFLFVLQRPERGGDFPAKHCLSYFFGKSRAESVRRTPPIRFHIRCDNGNPPSAACNDGFRRQSARQLRCSPSAGDKKAGGDIADKQVPENKRMKEKY